MPLRQPAPVDSPVITLASVTRGHSMRAVAIEARNDDLKVVLRIRPTGVLRSKNNRYLRSY